MGAGIAWGQMQGNRESQQDRALCLAWENGSHLMVLADGIGGCAGGEIASHTVVDHFRSAFVNSPDLMPRDRLLTALQEANLALYDRAEEEPSLAGMGTTLVAAAALGDALFWVSVGDSPMWLFRDRAVLRLNENHSVGGALDRRVQVGEISRAEAASALSRGDLLEAVTGYDIRLVDAPKEPLNLRGGDTVVLASDGVETCSEDELVGIVSAAWPSPSHLVEAILEAVEGHERASQDNATVIVYRPDEKSLID